MGLFFHTVLVFLLAVIAFYIGSKVAGQTENGDGKALSGVFGTNSGASDNASEGSDATDSAGNGTYEAGTSQVVVVDPGHGGTQPGAVVTTSDGEIYEKDINLAIALFLDTMLDEAGYDVILTRDTDCYVSLETRVEICNGSDATLFVSIHQNILENDTETNGVETWYWDGSSEGLRLAGCLQEGIVEATGANSLGLKAADDLYVLHYTAVPSALVESGFLSCGDELKNLLDSSYQEKIAEGIYEGILNYLK